MSVQPFKVAALEELGELGFSHPLSITQEKCIIVDMPAPAAEDFPAS
jgi:hypothetical protein